MQNINPQLYPYPTMIYPKPILYRLVVSNLSYETTEAELELLFGVYGCVKISLRRNEILQFSSALVFFNRREDGTL